MLTFKQYRLLSEATKDLYAAIGKYATEKLIKTKVDKKVKSIHDKVFGEGNHHIEMPLPNPVPEKVIDHVKSQGDEIDGDKVKLKSGRSVELSKYLPKSKAPKSVIDDHENWAKNKSNSNTKLVVSRHPGEVASASTNTHWDSCANMKSDGPAKADMPNEIKHGTLIAMHVHVDAKPNEHGEYNSRDVLGRTLIKRHNSSTGDISFHREGRKYGAFPHVANEAVDKFTSNHYPMTGISAKKESSVYNDDNNDHKTNHNATSHDIDKALDNDLPDVRREAIEHPNATKEHIDKAITDKSYEVRHAAIRHPNATKEHAIALIDDSSPYVRDAARRRLLDFK